MNRTEALSFGVLGFYCSIKIKLDLIRLVNTFLVLIKHAVLVWNPIDK